jgi:serine/threonine protein kinase
VAFILKRLFAALDLLHDECNVAHTDIREENILLGAGDSSFEQFEKAELRWPSPAKEVDGVTIYLSRQMGIPEDVGAPFLCDFGSAVLLDDGLDHRESIQPNTYRAPEVILEIPWTYSVDIWNVGCLVSTIRNDRRHWKLNFVAYRSGTCSKASACLPDMIRSCTHTKAVPISLKRLPYLGLLLQVCLLGQI